MISTIAEPGTKIEMIRLNNSLCKVVEKRKYYSRIEGLLDDETVKISMPIPMEVGDRYQFIFYTKSGLHQCNGVITEHFKEGIIPIAIVYFETDMEKFQKRQYYRLECAMEIQYRIISKEEIEKQDDLFTKAQEQWNRAIINEISGNGCRFNSQLEHMPEEKIKLRLNYLLNNQTIYAQYAADIVYAAPLIKRQGYYEYRIEFDIKDILDQEMLIKFIFEEERKIRKRERGLI